MDLPAATLEDKLNAELEITGSPAWRVPDLVNLGVPKTAATNKLQ